MLNVILSGMIAMNVAGNYSVFQCSDILGSVFEDENRNGVQDAGERGLPGIRIVSINGVWITSDRFGRFHLPCASMPPAGRGGYYALRVYEPSLPDGYKVASTNPLVIRVSPGQMQVVRFAISGNPRSATLGLFQTGMD